MKRLFSVALAVGMLLLAACGSVATAGTVTPAPSAEAVTPSPLATVTPAVSATPVPADWTPSQKITLIVGYKEGSGTDVGARLLAEQARPYLGQPMEVKNLPSTSGMAAWETLAASKPDGYTLGVINMPNVFTAIENGANFTMQSFTPVCSHLVETSVVVVAANSPYETLEDLLEANRAASESGELMRAATNGVQASNDIGAALLAYSSGGWKFRHVAYGSTNDQLTALLAGECDWSVAKISDILPMLKANAEAATEETAQDSTDAATQDDGEGETSPAQTVRVLGVFDTARSADLPDVPTLDELGYPTGWYGSTRAIVAPAGTDPTIIAYYAEALRKTMEDPACIAAHKEAGLALSYLGPDDLATRIDDRSRFNNSLMPKLFT